MLLCHLEGQSLQQKLSENVNKYKKVSNNIGS